MMDASGFFKCNFCNNSLYLGWIQLVSFEQSEQIFFDHIFENCCKNETLAAELRLIASLKAELTKQS